MISCSVILVQYNPNKEKLIRTVESIVRQKNVQIQLIVADDGSSIDYWNDLERVLIKSEIVDYYFCKNKNNQGTVINIQNALQYTKYRFVSMISPGDYYYDEYTVSEMIQRMQEGYYRVLFGRIVPYTFGRNGLKIVNRQYPLYLAPYVEFMKSNKYKSIQKKLVLYNDVILGAVLYWEKSLLMEYIELISGKVIYAEDLITKFAVLDEERIAFIDRYVTWYEYGEGISTLHTSSNNQKLDKDAWEFSIIMSHRYPNSKLVKRTKRLGRIIRIGGLKSKILRSILFPDRFFYILIHSFITKEYHPIIKNDFIQMLYRI